MRRLLAAALSILLLSHPLGAQAAGGLQTGRVMGDLSFAHVGSQTLPQALVGSGSGAGGGISSALIGAAGGLATLDGNKLLLTSQVPFGTQTGKVADGGALAATAATASAAIPSSMIGAASGIASLNGAKQLPAAQIPFGTISGTVADGGALASTSVLANNAVSTGSASTPGGALDFVTLPLSGARQNFLAWFQSVSVGLGRLAGDASNTTLKAMGDSVAISIASWAGQRCDISMHGGSGTAAGDDAAVTFCFAYAKLHPHAVVWWPTGSYPMLATQLFTYLIPSDTTLDGPHDFAANITWNDDNNQGWYLFGVDTSQLGTGRARNIAVRNLHFSGTWGSTTDSYGWTDPPGGAGSVLDVFSTDGVEVDHVITDHLRAFGIDVSGSTQVSVHDNRVTHNRSDGISSWEDDDLSVKNNFVENDNDDCISAHSDLHDPWLVRRYVDIEGNTCLQTSAIDVLGAKYWVIMGNRMGAIKGSAITVDASAAGPANGPTQGENSMTAGIISFNLLTDLIARGPLDNANQSNLYIDIEGNSARPGQYNTVPGQAGFAGQSTAQSPYPEFFVVAQAATTGIGESHEITVSNNTISTNYPSFDGSDKNAAGVARYSSWTAFGEPTFDTVTTAGSINPSLNRYTAFGGATGIGINGYLRDLAIDDNHINGIYTGVMINNGVYTNLEIKRNTFSDISNSGVEDNNQNGKILGFVTDNTLDMDPYFQHGRGGSGNWNNDGGNVAFRVDPGAVSGITYQRNYTMNASDDVAGVDPSNPTSGDYFSDNVDYADPGEFWPASTVNSYNVLNVGIGYVHTSGFDLVLMKGDPTNPNVNTIYAAPIKAATAMPTTGWVVQGSVVKNVGPAVQPGSPTPVASWIATATGPVNLISGSYAPQYVGGVDTGPGAQVVQTTGGRNPDNGTSLTLTFASTPAAADTVLIAMMGSGYNNEDAAVVAPSGCTVIAGPSIAGYNVAQYSAYRVWTCTPAASYAFTGLTDGFNFTAMDISNFQEVRVTASAPNNGGSLNSVSAPAYGSSDDTRLALVGYVTPFATPTLSPSLSLTNYPQGNSSDSYHFAFNYFLSPDVGSSVTVNFSAAVGNVSFLELDLLNGHAAQFVEPLAYTVSNANCAHIIRDDGATASRAIALPSGLQKGCHIDLWQDTAYASTLTAASGITIHGPTATTSTTPHLSVDVLDAATVGTHY